MYECTPFISANKYGGDPGRSRSVDAAAGGVHAYADKGGGERRKMRREHSGMATPLKVYSYLSGKQLYSHEGTSSFSFVGQV